MNNIIKKIVEIEQRAQAIMSDTEKEKEEIESTINSESNRISISIKSKVEKKINQIRGIEISEAQNKVDNIYANTDNKIKYMEELAEKEKDEWVSKLMSNIIGR